MPDLGQPALLRRALEESARDTFNAITVDGECSTNDTLFALASGASGVAIDEEMYPALLDGMLEVSRRLAVDIVRGGEGATKVIRVTVQDARTSDDARQVARTIANSPLVKTAFFASDPNLGRILAAVGYAGVTDLDVEKVDLYLDDVLVAKNGARHAGYMEADGQRIMKQSEIRVRIVLNRGTSSAQVWTCDLSHDYVSINADYRS